MSEEQARSEEERVIDCLLNIILSDGFRISITAPDRPQVLKSNDRQEIMAAIGQDDITTLYVCTRMGNRCGQIILVHGEGADVIGQASETPIIKCIIAAVDGELGVTA